MENRSTIHAFHTSTTDSWQAMLKACDVAEQSILLEEFILEPDKIGHRFLDMFEKKAKQGLTVKLLLDWWGCRALAKSGRLKDLENSGIEVRFFRPPEWNWLTPGLGVFPRDHRKLLIIDHQKTFVGGVCIYDEITDWRDTMVEVSGGLTDQFQHIFNATWQKVNRDETAILAHPDFETDEKFSVYANAPDSGEMHFTEALVSRIKNAEHTIRLATPYFTSSKTLVPLLIEASKKGVNVEILLSSYSEYPAYVVGKAVVGPLIKAGVKTFYYEPTMLHLKMMIIDDEWSAIGSFNLDGLSIHHNQETMLASTDVHFTTELLTHFKSDKSNLQPMGYDDWKRRPLSEKIMGKLLSPFKHYL